MLIPETVYLIITGELQYEYVVCSSENMAKMLVVTGNYPFSTRICKAKYYSQDDEITTTKVNPDISQRVIDYYNAKWVKEWDDWANKNT